MAAFGLIPINVHRKSDGENMSLKTTKKTESITVQSDQGGKHEHHEQVAERQRQSEIVNEHIKNLPVKKSHYSRKANPDRKEVTSHYSRKRFPDRRYYESTKQDDGKHCCECTKSAYGKDCECTKSDYGIQLIYKIKM